jgi:hypothetical protein
MFSKSSQQGCHHVRFLVRSIRRRNRASFGHALALGILVVAPAIRGVHLIKNDGPSPFDGSVCVSVELAFGRPS